MRRKALDCRPESTPRESGARQFRWWMNAGCRRSVAARTPRLRRETWRRFRGPVRLGLEKRLQQVGSRSAGAHHHRRRPVRPCALGRSEKAAALCSQIGNVFRVCRSTGFSLTFAHGALVNAKALVRENSLKAVLLRAPIPAGVTPGCPGLTSSIRLLSTTRCPEQFRSRRHASQSLPPD